ncbi:MAG: hypothetical protein LBM76_02410 [Mycoplasmataceae bacterium]|jgi:hypothetical protein|nr:hypothetical protein [Mycoplasmataceae bacterium]
MTNKIKYGIFGFLCALVMCLLFTCTVKVEKIEPASVVVKDINNTLIVVDNKTKKYIESHSKKAELRLDNKKISVGLHFLYSEDNGYFYQCYFNEYVDLQVGIFPSNIKLDSELLLNCIFDKFI